MLTIQAEHLRKTFGAKVCVLQLPQVVDVSSTRLRELLARGEGWEYLSPAVYGYILRHGLYGAGRDLKRLPDRELRACSYSMIRAKRIAHVKGTEEEAVRLARRWGADEEHARRAAILHDCTKYLELDEQLQLCAKYGIVLDELEQQAVKLLHSKTGACVARHVYGVSDDIYEAIFWHTTGKADMTLLVPSPDSLWRSWLVVGTWRRKTLINGGAGIRSCLLRRRACIDLPPVAPLTRNWCATICVAGLRSTIISGSY